MSYDVNALRAREYPWAARGDAIYLNSASTGAIPARTVRALAAFDAIRHEPYRLTDELEFETLRRSRALAATLVGAREREIAVMVNTTYGINVAARTLPLRRGDIVVGSDREFPANVYPWMALAREGVRYEQLPCRDGWPDEEAILAALERPRVRVLALSWVAFATGYRVDLARLGEACRARGIWFVVDAIQGLGATRLDVHACGIDVLACGGQKWLLAPWGSGFLYVREELARTLEPNVVGWMAMRASEDFTRLTEYAYDLHEDARRFEVITVPFPEFAGFNASVGMLVELGLTDVERHIAGVVQHAVEWASDRRDVRLVSPADPARRAGIVAIAPADPAAASARLARARVSHSLREGAIRLSPHCWNTREEMARALAVMVGEDD